MRTGVQDPDPVRGLTTFFKAFGTLPQYCVDVADDGLIHFIACFGGNFTTRKLHAVLAIDEVAHAIKQVPSIRIIATHVGRDGILALLRVNPGIEVVQVTSRDWEGDMDKFNQLRKIRYGRWPQSDCGDHLKESGPSRYGLGLAS